MVIADIDKRLEGLQIQLLKLVSARADFGDVTEGIYRLRDENQDNNPFSAPLLVPAAN